MSAAPAALRHPLKSDQLEPCSAVFSVLAVLLRRVVCVEPRSIAAGLLAALGAML